MKRDIQLRRIISRVSSKRQVRCWIGVRRAKSRKWRSLGCVCIRFDTPTDHPLGANRSFTFHFKRQLRSLAPQLPAFSTNRRQIMRSPESHGNVRDSQRSKGQKKKAKDMDSVKRKGSVKKITSRNNTPHAHATSPAVLSPVPQNANRQPGEANGYVFIVPKGAVGANQQHPSPGGTPGVTNQSPAIDPFFVPPGTANANPNPQVQASVPAVNPTQQADTGDGHYENFLPMALRK